ncbi:DUF971 domain-containing protein [Exilibacterium tricleocarpae]|uniref:DUF971 domain-containing protein n=1 Tax=Exilibacterium tricleocarpae TaxID=2591008 RepID=A0A545T617_9GAMM|nr:DUF971 domain-containing protein [Exilibacterium tricleocarpae]TQV72663.1 DUF971 domain-containing protein [Exilibacterium tricleocarpae]
MTTIPDRIQLHKRSKQLELQFGAAVYQLSCEFLRVHSPSAEVKGHGPGQEVLQVGKKDVGIEGLETSGNYAVRIIFDDGHDSGIYSWEYLHHLCRNQASLWADYLQALEQAGAARDPHTQVVNLIEPGKS